MPASPRQPQNPAAIALPTPTAVVTQANSSPRARSRTPLRRPPLRTEGGENHVEQPARRAASAPRPLPSGPHCECGERRPGQPHNPFCPVSRSLLAAASRRAEETNAAMSGASIGAPPPVPDLGPLEEPPSSEAFVPATEFLTAALPMWESIPRAARVSFGWALSKTMKATTNASDVQAWSRLLALPRAILYRSPAAAGAPAHTINKRCRRWCAEGFKAAPAMLREALEHRLPSRPVDPNAFTVSDLPCGRTTTAVDIDSLPSGTEIRALKLARQGFYSRATAALSAAQVADASAAANAEAMTRLHPKAPSEPSLLPPPAEQDAAPRPRSSPRSATFRLVQQVALHALHRP
jgi:hypothetical protein